jgi:hypothetical protein
VSTQILRTMALQLLRQHLDLASLIANEFLYCGSNCGIVQLKLLIPKLLEIIPQTRIIVDKIDKCSNENQKAILRDIHTLFFRPNARCNILLSSQKEVHILKKLARKPQITLDRRSEVKLNIRSYVKHNIKKLRTSDELLLDRLENILAKKVNSECLLEARPFFQATDSMQACFCGRD